MKLYIKSLALAALALGGTMAFTACTEDKVYDVDINDVPQASDYADNVVITVDQETNTARFSFTGKGVYPVWIIDGKSYSSNFEFTRYYRKAGDYSVDVKIGNGNGLSQGTITKTFNVEKTIMNGFPGFVYDSEFNLWTKATKQNPTFYYAPGWADQGVPTHSFDGETINLSLPTATNERRQCQMHIATDISLNEGEAYDGSAIFTATKDMKDVLLKIHPTGDDNDNHSFFFSQKVNLTAGEPQAFWFSGLEAVVPMNDLIFTFDFGGNPDNVEITIENIVLKSHANDDGTVLPELPTTPEPNWVDVNSPENLWSTASFEQEFYYAPGWSQIADPKLTFDGKNFSVELPAATSDQWQAQVKLHTDLTVPDNGVGYDFKIVLTSNLDHPGATVKLVQTDEGEDNKHDNNFFFVERIPLTADAPYTFWVANVKAPEPMHAVSLVLDFGGCAEGTVIDVKDITLQVHHD